MDIPLIHLRSSSATARAFAEEAAHGLYCEACVAVDHAARLLACLKAAGLPGDKRAALRDLLLDTFGDVQGGINKVLDDEGIVPGFHQVDVSEI